MKPIERISIVEQVIDRLTNYIVENNLVTGDKMPTENEVCQMVGAGRSTVREAYRMMQAMGILEVRRGKGIFFIKFSKDVREAEVADWFKENGQTIADYMEVRLAIETMAVKLALQNYEEQKVEELKELALSAKKRIAKTEDASKRAVKMTLYDEEFHELITEMSGNDLLMKIQRNISECLADYRNQLFMLDENIERAHVSHWNYITTFEKRNEEEALEQVAMHLHSSLVDMEKVQNRVDQNKNGVQPKAPFMGSVHIL
ncbi:MAG: GntR family transcriptional regulator [Lachnospiraceae bacterium]